MSKAISRRSLAKLLGSAAAAASLPGVPAAVHAQTSLGPRRSFPQGFLWGSATASYQVEGAAAEDGRGPSIWDTFSHTRGKTFNGDTGDVADDFYHRFPEDIRLMQSLGLKAFRLSISWSRIFPTGTGTPNQKGVDFYNRLIDALLAAGVQPFCTLFHWDLPQALASSTTADRTSPSRNGWQSRDTAEAFAAYAGFMAKSLADRVSHFMTTNEISTFIELGYGNGLHAPGLKLPPKAVAQAAHHAVLAHGLGVQAIRANAKAGTLIGLAENPTITCPAIENDLHIGAAHIAMREENARYLTVILEGRYTDRYLARLGPDAPTFTPEDMRAIGAPLDFIGMNCYQPTWVRADGSPQGYQVIPPPKSYPHMASPWLSIGPEGLYWGPRLINDLWKPKAIYITENGSSSDDVVDSNGLVLDTDRVMFLRNYLSQLQRTIADGSPVKGYFLWSLLDNFEWADGYSKRFGIVYVDFKTQKRIPKLSADFYRATIARNSVA